MKITRHGTRIKSQHIPKNRPFTYWTEKSQTWTIKTLGFNFCDSGCYQQGLNEDEYFKSVPRPLPVAVPQFMVVQLFPNSSDYNRKL